MTKNTNLQETIFGIEIELTVPCSKAEELNLRIGNPASVESNQSAGQPQVPVIITAASSWIVSRGFRRCPLTTAFVVGLSSEVS